MNHNLDWNKYRETFPSRYILPGKFDSFLEEHIRTHEPYSAIDIGGGTTGTEALRPVHVVYHMDPHTPCPPWQIEIEPGEQPEADLVIARGAVNYLSDEELQRIPDMVLPGGYFIANTFFDPPPLRVQKMGRLDGTIVTTTSFVPTHGNYLIHRIDEDGCLPIIHTIRILPRKFWETLLPGVEILKENRSYTLIWRQTS